MKNLPLAIFILISLFSCSDDSVSPENDFNGTWKGELNCNQVQCQRGTGAFWQFDVLDTVGDSLRIENFIYDIGDVCQGDPNCSSTDQPERETWVTSTYKGDSVTIAYNTKSGDNYQNTIFKGVFAGKRLEGKVIVNLGGLYWDGVSSDPIQYEERHYTYLYSDDATFTKQ